MKSNVLRSVDDRQDPLPLVAAASEVRIEDIARQTTIAGALAIGAAAAGLDLEKEVHIPLGIDAGQWSRIRHGTAGWDWKKIQGVCDLFGNDAVVLWMLHQRGYDLHSLRKRETETERKLREAQERIAELERDKRVLAEAIRGGL